MSLEDFAGLPLEAFAPGSFDNRNTRPVPENFHADLIGKRKDRTEFSLAIRLSAFEANGAGWTLGVIEDISEQKLAKTVLRESEQLFQNMADGSQVMICSSDADRRATFFNRAWLAFTGRALEEELGYGWLEGVHGDDRDRCLAEFHSSFDARRHCYVEYRLRRADGEYRWITCSGVPRFGPAGLFAGYIASCIDTTAEKQAHEDALTRDRLKSVAVLANVIAHDFNNLFGSILTSAEIASAALAESASIEEELQRIRAATSRGAELVRQLAIYGDSNTASFQPVDFRYLIEEMRDLLRVSVSRRIDLRIDFNPELPAVNANPAKMRQVVMNLVLNASEAIGEHESTVSFA